MKIGKYEIEKGIAPLVSTLNDIPFIETISSCEGHFPNYKAKVIFNVKDEEKNQNNLENLMREILIRTCRDWSEVTVDFNKRYYSIPDTNNLTHNWYVDIRPHPAMGKGDIRKKAVEREIQKITQIASDYNKVKKF